MISETPDLVITLLAAFLGAIIGSVGTYLVARLLAQAENKDTEIAGIQNASIKLILQFNLLKNIRNSSLDSERGNKFRWFSLMPMTTGDYVKYQIDTSDLRKVLKKDPNLLLDISVSEDSFYSAIYSLNYRAELYEKFVQPSLQLFPKEPNGAVAATAFENHLPDWLVKSMKVHTDSLYEHIDNSIAKIGAAIDRLYDFGKKEFPKERFYKLVDN